MSVCVLHIEVKLTLQTKLYGKIFHVENYCYYCQIASVVWRTGLTETLSRAFADTTCSKSKSALLSESMCADNTQQLETTA